MPLNGSTYGALKNKGLTVEYLHGGSRDSKDNELWEFKGYFSKIADLPPNILSEIKKNWIENAKMRTIS